MSEMTAPDVPEQGQLVEVRRRRHVVADVVASQLPVDPLSTDAHPPQHLIMLRSIEDDALGEELQVIWELEPGAQIREEVSLPAPDGFDPPHRLDAFLNAVRWGAIASADVKALQAPFRSGIDIEDYQLDPVVRALDMPRVNLLIADDVGLGKTIEAGLVAQELIIRQRARRILVVCPASLQIHWRDQMRDKFGLEFRVVDSELMRQLRRTRGIHVNPWTHFPRLITSIDYLKRDRPIRLFRETLPPEGELAYPRRFDLLIVDEAANIAPAGSGRYAIDSQRTAAIRLLAPHFEHKLFLTATPHNGYVESFSALLELLDNQRFARGVPPDRKLLASVMVRRLKSELPPQWDGTPRFQSREIKAIEVAYTIDERQAHDWLQDYTLSRRARRSNTAERTGTEFVLKLLKKRMFSSPAAFEQTLSQHLNSLKGLEMETPARRRHRPSEGILKRMIARIDEDYADDREYAEAEGDAVHAASSLFDELSGGERVLLSKLEEWAERATALPGRKARALIDWLNTHIRPNGEWSSERVIIFTEYRDTQTWLQERLAAEGLTQGGGLDTIYGGMDSQKREAIKAAFQANPDLSPVRILLATDAASEGIDLQLHCHRVIHYEIPWNPNRMEQRNGRIDRHGQLHSPLIYHFVPQGFAENAQTTPLGVGRLEGDLEFLMRAVRKVERIRQDLGKVGPVIASQVKEAMLGSRQQLDTSAAEKQAEPSRQMLRFERDLRARIAELHAKLRETQNHLKLSPENVQSVVEIALELASQPALRETEVQGIWPDPSRVPQRCPVFRLPALTGSWARCTEGLAHPHTGDIRPLVFDHTLVRGRDDVVLAHLNHRLVQMSLRLLRAEVWSTAGAQRLHRVTARVVPDGVLESPAVIAHARLVVIGGNKTRLHEEIITAGGTISAGRFRRMNVGQLEKALAAQMDVEASQATKDRFTALWSILESPLTDALTARMRDRVNSLKRLLEQREVKEVSDITALLGELERVIRDELTEPQYLQLELFSNPEREQYNRNVSALQARLQQLPGELEAEQMAIAARYADPEARLFPVAVTFLVPVGLA